MRSSPHLIYLQNYEIIETLHSVDLKNLLYVGLLRGIVVIIYTSRNL